MARAPVAGRALGAIALAALPVLAGCQCGPAPGPEPPPRILSLTPATLPLDPGDDSTLSVTLDRVAPAGALVQVFSSNSGVVVVPESITVVAGASTAVITLAAENEGIATVTVALNGSAASSTVTVGDAPLPTDAGPGTDAAPPPDSGADSGTNDAGTNDAGTNDAGTNDAGST